MSTHASERESTQLLLEAGRGNEQARERMLALVYDELKRIASSYMSGERRDHTLQPTALVHEAYLRLIDQRQVDWRNRAQFVGIAATMMRRILLNYARDRKAAKRGGDAPRVSADSAEVALVAQPELDIQVLDEALERLAGIDPRKAKIVELKFFGGLTTEEIAQVLEVSRATIERDWSFARAWLYDAIDGVAAKASERPP